MTSSMKTFVEVSDMLSTSRLASLVEVETYLATEPNPGQLSVKGRSLSMVFGIPIHVTGNPRSAVILAILFVVS